MKPDDRSYVSAIAKKVRVTSQEEKIILASQLFFQSKTYLARQTWEWGRDLVDHSDKKTSPDVSVAIAHSYDGEFYLYSVDAGISFSHSRLRLAL